MLKITLFRQRIAVFILVLSLLITIPEQVFATAGSIDTSFAQTGTGLNNIVSDTVIQSDGKIIAVGDFTQYNGTSTARIIRLNSNGTHDTSFMSGTGFVGSPARVLLQSDEKIIVTGSFTSYTGNSRNYLIRLNTNGTVDTGFSIGTGLGNTASALALQDDGKILVGGSFTTYNGSSAPYLVRINTDGSIDTGFTQTGTGLSGAVTAIAIQDDGKIVVGGSFTSYNGTTVNRIARLNSDGSLDSAFTTAAGTGFSSGQVLELAIADDGKILAGGSFTSFNSTTVNRIARLNSDGSLDTDFATTVSSGFNSTVNALTIDLNGKILVGGAFTTFNITNSASRIARLKTDGSFDSGFVIGTGFNTSTSVLDIEIQTDYQIIASGSFTSYRSTSAKYVARIDHLALPEVPGDPDLADASDSGSSNTDNFTNDTTPTIIGTCTTGEEVYVKVGGTETGQYVTCSGGTYSITLNTLSDGANQVSVFASSTGLASSGISADSNHLVIDINTTIPTAVITYPEAGATGITSPVTVTGTCSSDESIEIDPGDVSTSCSLGLFSGDISFASDPTTITVTITSFYGNSSTTSVTINQPAEEEEEETPEENEATSTPRVSTSRRGGIHRVTPPNFDELLGRTPLNTQTLSQSSQNARVCPFFVQTLRIGARDAGNNNQVARLQKFLNDEVGANLPITGYFYVRTESAVKKFQEKYRTQILTPQKLQNPTGFWGNGSITTAHSILGCTR